MIFIYMILIPMGLGIIGSVAAFCYVAIKLYRESKRLEKINCLVWRHPNHVKEQMPILETTYIDNPPGGIWNYKPSRFLGDKTIYWCWEVEVENNGKKEYKLKEFNPDDYIRLKDRPGSQSSLEVGDGIDNSAEMRIRSKKGKLLQTLAMGGLVALGLASVVGIIFLSVFVGG